MTVVVVTLAPLGPEALPRLPATASVSAEEATELYRAMAADTLRAAADSSGDLLVHYPDPERATGDDPEATARELAADAGIDLDPDDEDEAVRFEVQVGSSPSARAGNAVTHLLEEEGAATVAVVPADVPLLARTQIDSAAMRLRSNDVVLGPAERGRVYYAGFAEPADFAGALAPPALPTLAARGRDAGLEVDFLPQLTRVETGDDLCSVVAAVRARETAGRAVPEHTAAVVEALGLDVELAGEDDAADGDVTLVRRDGA